MRELAVLQQARLLQRQGELWRWECSLGPEDAGLQQRASDRMEQIVQDVRAVVAALEGAATLAERRTAAQLAQGEFSTAQIRSLQRRAEALLAEVLVDFVELSAPSVERSAAMHESEARLKMLSEGWDGDLETWQSRLLRIRLLRVIGQTKEADALIRSALSGQPVPALKDLFVAEQVRLDLASAQLDVALQRLLDYGRERGQLVDELKTLQVEALLAAVLIATEKGDLQLANDLRAQAERTSKQTDGAWGNRSWVLLSQAEENRQYGLQLARLMRSARAAYLAGEQASAATQYLQASVQASERNQAAAAEEFAFTAGSIQLEQKSYQEAVETFALLLQQAPAGPRAADADLLRAYALGQLFETEPTRARRRAVHRGVDGAPDRLCVITDRWRSDMDAGSP